MIAGFSTEKRDTENHFERSANEIVLVYCNDNLGLYAAKGYSLSSSVSPFALCALHAVTELWRIYGLVTINIDFKPF